MKFDKNGEAASGLVDGECEFQVLEASERISKNNKPYINLKCYAVDRLGNQATVFDNVPPFKVPGLLKAIGKEALIDAEEVHPHDLVNCSGRMVLTRKPGEKYMSVSEYVARKPGQENVMVGKPVEDDLPF